MWTKYLIIGILSSSVIIFSSCYENVTGEPISATRYVYENKLDIPVEIEYHWTESEIETAKTVIVNVGQSHIDIASTVGPHEIMIIECDSVRFIFNDLKELWYFSNKEADRKGNVFEISNYAHKKDSEREETYLYEISQEIYNLASEI